MALRKLNVSAPCLPKGSLDIEQIKVFACLRAPFLMGKKRKLLAVGRKRMLCVSYLGMENIFGVSLFFCYHRQNRT